MIDIRSHLKTEPLVSVIIACHNASPYIDQCISSICNQTYRNIEIVICDDASSDDSVSKINQWAKRDERIILMINQQNMKASYTRNRCIEASKGDFFLIQDIDDYSVENRIEVLLNVMCKEPELGIVSSAMKLFTDKSIAIKETDTVRKEYPQKKDFIWDLPFSHGASMLRREAVLAVKGYNEDPIEYRQEDYAMFMRIYSAGYRGKNIKNILYYYRYDERNISRSNSQQLKNYAIVRFRGYKILGLLPWALPFVLKPYAAYVYRWFLLKISTIRSF